MAVRLRPSSSSSSSSSDDDDSIKIVLTRKYMLDGSQEWALKGIESYRNDAAAADDAALNDADADDPETVKVEVNEAAIALINMKSSPVGGYRKRWKMRTAPPLIVLPPRHPAQTAGRHDLVQIRCAPRPRR